MIFLKFLGTLWLVYLSLVFVRSFKESLRRERENRMGGGANAAPPGSGAGARPPYGEYGPFGPFGPFGPQGGRDPFEEAARAWSQAAHQARSGQQHSRQAPQRSAPGSSPWEVLRIAPNASDKEIRRAYQELIRQYHPDRLGQIEGLGDDLRALAEQRTKEITAAYNQLKKKP